MNYKPATKVDIINHHIKNRCVHAISDITKGEIIEIAPVVPFTVNGSALNELDDYPIAWRGERDCIAMGISEFINHSQKPNAKWYNNFKNKTITLKAIKDIYKGEEVTIHYRCKLWFKPI